MGKQKAKQKWLLLNENNKLNAKQKKKINYVSNDTIN